MPEDIQEALTRIAATLPPVDWPEPAELRHRGTVRRRRQAVVAAAAVVAVLAVGGLAIRPGGPILGGTGVGQAGTATAGRCADGGPPANLNLPERATITINVYNGTLTDGLAGEVGNQLERIGFKIGVTGNGSDVGVTATDQIAVIRFGPPTVGAAFVVLAYFPDAHMDFDIHREADTVDVVIGDQFLSLPSVTEVNRNIAANGRPTAPAGTCVGD